MRKLSVVLLVLAFSLTFIGALQAADKLGYVDLSRVFAEYGKTKEYDKVLTDKENAANTEIDKKVNELKQLKDKYDMLSDKEKAAKEPELNSKIKTFQEFKRQKDTDLRKEQDEKMKEILKDIETAVKQYAEKEGFTLIFNDRVLVYQSKSLDITDSIVDILKKSYTKK